MSLLHLRIKSDRDRTCAKLPSSIMLSAVAARKLRESLPTGHTSIRSSESHALRSPLPPKRKSVDENSNNTPSIRKKQKKSVKPKRTAPTRYYDAPKSLSESNTDDDVSSDDDSDDEVFLPVASTSNGWSPSVPAGASDDEMLPESAPLPPPTPPNSSPVISTFHAIEDQNFVRLELAEASVLLGSSDDVESALFVLDPGQSIGLLGTYSLYVLQGGVAISGTILDARGPHTIHAPKCSPIPVLEGLASSTPVIEAPSPRLTPVLSSSTGKAVVVIQALRTGVEGLGRAVRTFEDVYSSRSSTSWEVLRGVQLVIGLLYLAIFINSLDSLD